MKLLLMRDITRLQSVYTGALGRVERASGEGEQERYAPGRAV